MSWVVDASIAIKWLVPEVHSEAAERLLASTEELVAPDFLLVEASNVLWKKVRRGELRRQEARDAEVLLGALRLQLRPTAPLVRRALQLALELEHPVYDCVYLALAETEGRRMVSDDRTLLARVRGRRSLPAVVPLTSL